MYVCMYVSKLVTLVEGDQKAPLSIATLCVCVHIYKINKSDYKLVIVMRKIFVRKIYKKIV